MIVLDALTPHSLFDYIQWGGIVTLLLLFVFGLFKKWWVMGWQYKAIEESNVRWMELALRSTNLAESVTELRKERPL